MHHRPFEMSGGQQQRVAIARSLANSPSLILADEPTGELDTQTAHEIMGLFQSIVKQQNVTVLMVTHDHISDEYVDDFLFLRDGSIVASSEVESVAELYAETTVENQTVSPVQGGHRLDRISSWLLGRPTSARGDGPHCLPREQGFCF